MQDDGQTAGQLQPKHTRTRATYTLEIQVQLKQHQRHGGHPPSELLKEMQARGKATCKKSLLRAAATRAHTNASASQLRPCILGGPSPSQSMEARGRRQEARGENLRKVGGSSEVVGFSPPRSV